uniref:ribonuclease H n=1 Tax=Oryzias latipes TaxID=8090 RepID=A0A3P9MPT2_ORYLA
MAFVDYEKAFDSILHKAVIEALEQHSVEEKYINILKETYDGGTAQVRNESLSRKIKIMKGVRQGDTLSPVMFTAALEEIFRRMEAEAGININGERMNNLRFADDIILFAEKEEDLSKLLNDLNKEGRKDGMKMNKKKTQIMCNETARKRRRKGTIVDGEQLEEVDEYKYLGRLLTPGNEMAKEIDERVTSAWKRFGQYSTFLRDQKMPVCLKRKIMNTFGWRKLIMHKKTKHNFRLHCILDPSKGSEMITRLYLCNLHEENMYKLPSRLLNTQTVTNNVGNLFFIFMFLSVSLLEN